MLQKVIFSISRSLLFFRLLYAGGIQHGPQMWEKQLCRCKMSSCDVGACAALASTDGWKLQSLPFPLSHPPVKLGLEAQILITCKNARCMQSSMMCALSMGAAW